MKRTVFALILTGGLVMGTWGLDSARLAGLEKDLGPLMETLDPAALQALDAQLTPQLAPTGTPAAVWLRAGIVSHNLSRALGTKGVVGNAAKAVARFQSPARGSDQEVAALALGYLGSATALEGAEDWNPAAKVGDVNRGWDLLTEAVDRYGGDTFLPRFLRASVGISLPDFFGKTPAVLADLQALEAWDQTHPGRMGNGLLAEVALLEGTVYKKQKKLDQAVEAWTRAAALDPKKLGAGKAAADNLDRYGS